MRVLLQARISPQSLVLDAVEHSRTDALELLLQCKADVMTDTTHVLHSAFSTICTRTLDVLLSAKAAVNAEFCGQTALRVAVQADHVPLIRQLIQAKAHVDADAFTRNPQEGTPLICAVRRGFVRAARLLLCAKADTQRTSKFCTPLFIATSLSNVRMMRVLLDAKANVDDGGISDGGSSGFFLGPTPHPDPDFDLGAGPCGRKRPLLAESANLAAVRTLVKAKADVNRTGGVCYPYPPAHTAILRDNLPMLDLLLAHGARTDVCIQPFGWNLLHTAVWMDSKRIVRRLVGLCPALLCGRTTSCWQGLQVGAGLLPVDLARRKDPSCRMRDLLVTAYAPGICSD
jgi:hypothetical protein